MELLTSQVERQANKYRLREAELLLSRYGRNGPGVYFGGADGLKVSLSVYVCICGVNLAEQQRLHFKPMWKTTRNVTGDKSCSK